MSPADEDDAMPDQNDDAKGFDPADLNSTVIAIPLLKEMKAEPHEPIKVVIALHNGYGTPAEAAERVRTIVNDVIANGPHPGERIVERPVEKYVVARLTADSIRSVAARDRVAKNRAIYQIWPDFEVTALMNRSVATVKANAARTTFAAEGAEIVWAVVDSGIDGTHKHFAEHKNLELDPSLKLKHRDFTEGATATSALQDAYGHGTHVAGVIAGDSKKFGRAKPAAIRAVLDENGDTDYKPLPVKERFVGMAPKCKLVSYKVLDDKGRGDTTAIIAALQDIQKVNSYGDKLKIHGINLSVGYPIDPTWFACGQSPICVEVTRLVNSGVVVVVAAGNTGYGFYKNRSGAGVAAGIGQTINDPGNTEAAITVGSTHRDMPHTYGVSYFSSKGPTGDGRAKPDVIAPGEKILSCAAGQKKADIVAKLGEGASVDYVEDSGTSMAAAHVSGVIAAFLSIRNEFIGKPAEVKNIFTSTATDLGRVADFQGRGLIDLMRAIQSV
ncbi:peptidase S8/S53 subtilisin kexin sedolisin [Mycolicibacterium agri]|uniref:Peptidase S8 n=1 Tax=Mycolicibacterium agri TaxID=36811 RepID=A0A2A7MTP1_MYCAG|nr:S8 family peptidase [Mycolicibacterium agri]PEG35182.1 peptidase S8/S53 subtilisin kexin sedolisin [Mycolicibacterium agri]GFG49464.1 peptidase S8 [Mycolicibacterium agri]